MLMLSSEAIARESPPAKGLLHWRDRNAKREGTPVRAPSPPSSGPATEPPLILGLLCGAGAALFWAAGFAAGRHGIAIGFSPADLAFHRYVWAGLAFLPLWRATAQPISAASAGPRR